MTELNAAFPRKVAVSRGRRVFLGGSCVAILGALCSSAIAAEIPHPSTDVASGNAAYLRGKKDLGESILDRQGASLDLSVGAALALGGRSLETGNMKPSAPSLFLGISGTYALLEWLELGASLSLTAVGNRCWSAVSDKGECIETSENWASLSEDFTSATASLVAVAHYEIFDRFRLSGALSLGWSFFDPSPRVDLRGDLSVGAAVGILWTTPMEHFALGLSLGWQFNPEVALHALSLTPRIRYIF